MMYKLHNSNCNGYNTQMNTAFRLRTIFREALVPNPKNNSVHLAWLNALVNTGTQLQPGVDIDQLISVLAEQTIELEHQLVSLGVDEDLFREDFRKMRQQIRVSHDSKTNMGLMRPYFEESIKILSWASIVLGDQEVKLSEAELDGLRVALADLVAEAQKPEMPTSLRTLINRSAEKLHQSLQLNSLRGNKPIEDALTSILGDLLINKASLTSEEARPALSKFQMVMARAGSLATTGLKRLNDAGKAANDINAILKLGDYL